MHHPLSCCLILVGLTCLVLCLPPCKKNVGFQVIATGKGWMQVPDRHDLSGATQAAYDVVTCTSSLLLVLSVNALDDSTDCSIEEGCFDMVFTACSHFTLCMGVVYGCVLACGRLYWYSRHAIYSLHAQHNLLPRWPDAQPGAAGFTC